MSTPEPPDHPLNLFAGIDTGAAEERFDTLMSRPGLRIERIVSTGQSSPPGFWYDQPQDEWVLVVAGSAAVLLEGEPEPRSLKAGDHLLIPAHRRHRVEWTAPDQPTIWLAVHFTEDVAPHSPSSRGA